VNDTVGIPQASVAVAVPRAALISEAAGLHASVNVVPVAVITGGTRSLVHVKFWKLLLSYRKHQQQ
jgi:hypothetical protein